MSPEQQRIAIAEWCGLSPDKRYSGTPDYLNDLNAMHEAEKKTDSELDSELYVAQLLSVIHEVDADYFSKISWKNGYELTTATAAQRAEALLKTIWKWTEK